MRYRHIVVEGPIGVGKTSLARRLADHYSARLTLEDADENPFLLRFYQNPRRYALATQMSFLFQRAAQAKNFGQADLFSSVVVADFMLDKDWLFAKMNLEDDEFELYKRMYDYLAPQTPTPDLVIYLQAPVETLMERVRRRGIAYEKPIAENYLARLAENYSRYFHNYDAAPLLIVNTAHLDFVNSPDDFQLLLEKIEGLQGSRAYFNKAA